MTKSVRGVRASDVRASNDRAVLARLLDVGPQTASEIAQATGMTAPTVAAGLRALETAGLVGARGRRAGRAGKPPMVWGIAESAGAVMSLDVGTRLVRIQVDRIDGQRILQHHEPTSDPGAESTLAAIERCMRVFRKEADLDAADLRAVVLGSPGIVVGGHGGIELAQNLPGWSSSGIVRALRDLLGAALVIEKDVHLAARAEAALLDPEVRGDFVTLTVGRGVGAAVVIDGRLRTGHRDVAGEIGYLTVEAPGSETAEPPEGGVPDRRGGRTTLEDLASSTGVLARARARGLEHEDVASLADAARAGDADALAVLEHEARLLARGLEALVLSADPKVVVLTGSVGLAGGDELAAQVREQLRRTLPFDPPAVSTSGAGEDAILQGASIRAGELARAVLLGKAFG
jgi:predicted NBD/HSP70 family sugar kinase